MPLYLPVCRQHTGDTVMRKQVIRQKDLFEEASNERLLPAEALSEVVAQLALLMQSVIDAIETEVRDEQDPR
jgi:hypothetical protein